LWAHITVAILVECEVVSAQRAVIAPRLVDDRNVWRDLLLVDKPIERGRRPIGRIRCKTVRFDAKALLRPLARLSPFLPPMGTARAEIAVLGLTAGWDGAIGRGTLG
jgi:hypothetical protein